MDRSAEDGDEGAREEDGKRTVDEEYGGKGVYFSFIFGFIRINYIRDE